MSNDKQMEILKLCEGLNIRQATYRLELMTQYVRDKVLAQRIALVGLVIADE